MNLTNDKELINCDDDLSHDEMNDLLMNWALMSMDEQSGPSLWQSLNFDDAALNHKAKID